MRGVLASVLALSALSLGCAVTPAVRYERTTFVGLDVISYVPVQPRGMVFLFYGSGGSASFADLVETTDVLNRLIDQGYGFVSTSSTERAGDRRWDAANPSPTAHPDLPRLARLRAHLVDRTAMTSSTPLVGIGMCNGARFVTLWGPDLEGRRLRRQGDLGDHGTDRRSPVSGPGQLTVPTIFSTPEKRLHLPAGLDRRGL